MRFPGSEQNGQHFEREVTMGTTSFPTDYGHQQSIIRGPTTETRKSADDFVENLDGELWCRLPEDLLPKIFARLPFRSLFKVRLLSKEWEGKIGSPSFQLEATSEVLSKWETYSPLLCSTQDMRMVGYSTASRQWQSLFSLSYLFSGALSSSRWQTKSALGSLLCLKQLGAPGERGIVVTNPVLKLWKLLPAHGLTTPFLPAYEIIHLMSSQEKDSSAYKVISISQDSSIRDPSKASKLASLVPPDLLFPLPHLRAEIYDSTTGAWSVNESGPVLPMDLHNVSSVYLDGVVYFSLASSRYESIHLFAYNVTKGTWTAIPCPHESCSLVQLVRCGSSVMLVLISSAVRDSRKFKFGPPSCDSTVTEDSVSIFEIGEDLKITKACGGPVESIQGVNIVEGISGDEDSIYLQAFGRPLVVVFNAKVKMWSTVPLDLRLNNDSGRLVKMSSRYFGPCFNWTNSSFQPSLNSFVAP